jgi:glycosyltransferase involved in cell wall biosynthesis
LPRRSHCGLETSILFSARQYCIVSQTSGIPRELTAPKMASSNVRAPVATIVITTRNRRDELTHAIESCLLQSVDCEVIVIDDGSSDGTATMVHDRYPSVRVFQTAVSRGLIAQRNFAAGVAKSEFVVSLDDDARFSSRTIVEHAVREFDDPKIGVVAIPIINIPGTQIFQIAPDSGVPYATFPFIGAAHALRTQQFLAMGGYREEYVRQGEERDYAIRLLDRGYVVKMGSSDIVEHCPSPTRNMTEISFYCRRSDVLFGWFNVPAISLPWYLTRQIVETLVLGLQQHQVLAMVRGLFNGFVRSFQYWDRRSPVSVDAYRLSRRMERATAVPFEIVEKELSGARAPKDARSFGR